MTKHDVVVTYADEREDLLICCYKEKYYHFPLNAYPSKEEQWALAKRIVKYPHLYMYNTKLKHEEDYYTIQELHFYSDDTTDTVK